MSSTFQNKVVLLLSQAFSWNHPFTSLWDLGGIIPSLWDLGGIIPLLWDFGHNLLLSQALS
jgi:hypothetical protein